jgi:PAS domain S-box-containing protein
MRNARRMQKLVNLLLDFSRIEAGRMEADFTTVNIVSLTEDLASNFRSAIERAGMTLIIKSERIDDTVLVDIDMWEKIMLNLLSNAFKYSDTGTIEVAITKKGDFVCVSVTDSGVGIPESEIEKIFERFHRVQNVKGRTQEGTGIGLAMVRELIKLLGGTITVKSKVGKGSVFTVSLPLNKARQNTTTAPVKPSSRTFSQSSTYVGEAMQWIPETPDELTQPNTTTHPRTNTGSKPHTVLLADDNVDMRKYVQRLLENDYEVIAVADGEEACLKALQHNPALILSDIMMPKLDGFGLLKKLKENLSTRNIPIIFLSARAGEESKLEGLQAGADDYLTKPFSSKELLARVSNHIAISTARRQAEKEFYNLFLQSPAHIHVFKGPDHHVEFFHPLGIPFTGRDITGMKIREALPQLEGQGLFEMLDTVYNENTPIQNSNTKATFIDANGNQRDHYFDITYLPWLSLEGKVQGILQFSFEVTETVQQRMKAEANEKKFRNIAQQAPVAMALLMGPSHVVQVANDRVLEMWGKTYEEVIDKPVLAVFPEIVEQGLGQILSDVFTTGKPFIANEMGVTFMRQGRMQQMRINLLYEPLRNENNEVVGIVAVGTDVTEQVAARNKVAEAEERLRIATEILELGTWEYDPVNDIMHGSNKTIELFGFTPGTRLNLSDLVDAIVPEDRKRVNEAIQWSLNPQSKGKYDIEYSLTNINDKKQRVIRGNGQVFFDADGKPYRFIGTALDITDRKKAEEKLKASEARFRLLATSIPQIVWTNDKDGNTDYISGQFEKFTGKKPADHLRDWLDFVHEDDKKRLATNRKAAIFAGNEWNEEFRILNTITGNYRWFLGNSKPLKDASGKIIMWIGSASDIQDLKEQSNSLEQQVRERTKALEELNQSLKVSNEDLQQFAHVASHDLKEPIRKIKTYSNRLHDDCNNLLPEKGKSFLTKILSATDRMYSMIDGVLSYSTMAAADQPNERVDLNGVLKNIKTDLEVLIHDKNAVIKTDKLPILEGAPVLLYQLFYNLVNNSLKFAKTGVPPVIQFKSSTISIENTLFTKIAITDNGIGFEQEQAEGIFTTFTRLNSKDKYEGTGLGLALCKKIVQRHGGFISAKGEKDKGAAFTVLLPIK